MFDIFGQNIDVWFVVAQVFGLVGLVLMIVSFQINHKQKMLHLQILACIMHALQYLCLGALSGCLMSALAGARNYAYGRLKKVPKALVAMVVICIIVLTAVFYDGPASILPGIATVVYTVGFASSNLTIVRTSDVVACIFYIIYNIVVGAYTGLATSVLEMLFTLVAMLRFDWRWKNPRCLGRRDQRALGGSSGRGRKPRSLLRSKRC